MRLAEGPQIKEAPKGERIYWDYADTPQGKAEAAVGMALYGAPVIAAGYAVEKAAERKFPVLKGTIKAAIKVAGPYAVFRQAMDALKASNATKNDLKEGRPALEGRDSKSEGSGGRIQSKDSPISKMVP
jgi:hypothetical protein